MKNRESITTSKMQATQDSISGGKRGKTMRNLYRYLAVTVLSIGMAACQTDSVRSDVPLQPPASLLDIRPPVLNGSDHEFQAVTKAELTPQQAGCAWETYAGGYRACLEYSTSFWWLVWPHGHGFDSCFYTVWVESDGGHFTPWQHAYNQAELCN